MAYVVHEKRVQHKRKHFAVARNTCRMPPGLSDWNWAHSGGILCGCFCGEWFWGGGGETGTLISLQFIANNWPSTPFRWLRRKCWTAVLWSTNDRHIPTESMDNKLMALDETRGFPKTGF